MLTVLTRSEACKRAILEVTSKLSGPRQLGVRVAFVPSFAEANRTLPGPATCLIDLGSLGASADEIVTAVHRLSASRPWITPVLMAAHTNPELETQVIHGLRDLPRLGLLQAAQLSDRDCWRRLLDDQFVEQEAARIEADLRGACDHGYGGFFDDPEVRSLLRAAIGARKVLDLGVMGGAERVGVWRRFKRRWGLSPSEVLSLLRVLWAAHLRNQGYSSAEVAAVLGFQDTQHCAKRLGGRLGIRKSDINALKYTDVVRAIAQHMPRRAPIGAFVAWARATVGRASRASAMLVAVLSGAWDQDATLPGVLGAIWDLFTL